MFGHHVGKRRIVLSMPGSRLLLFIFYLSLSLLLGLKAGSQTPTPHFNQPEQSADKTTKGIYTGWGDIPPFLGIVRTYGDWLVRTYAFAEAVYDHQGGPRGGTAFFSPNSLAIAAEHRGNASSLILSGVFSLEPFTIGACGYPLLLSTGGTVNNKTLLVDRGLPFTLPTSLGVTYTINPAPGHALFTYWAPVGPPALGPVPSQFYPSIYMPELGITYNSFNSTRISYGVITGGYTYKTITGELSTFRGEGNGKKYVTLQEPRFDSYSGRLTVFHDPYSAQMSYGFIKKPDITTPALDIRRFTASASFFKKWEHTYTEITAGWGLDTYLIDTSTRSDPVLRKLNNLSCNALYLEAVCNLHTTHLFFARGELLQTPALFTQRCSTNRSKSECCSFQQELDTSARCKEFRKHNRGVPFTVGKLAAGYLRQLFFWNNLRFGIGASGNISFVPSELYPCYGKNPFSYFIFARVELADNPDSA